MAERVEVITKGTDSRSEVRARRINSMGFNVDNVSIVDVYTIDAPLKESELTGLASMLSNPVTQEVAVNKPLAPPKFAYAVEIGFLPGVTDNVGNTAREIFEDGFRKTFDGQIVYSSSVMFLSGNLVKADAVKIGGAFSNPIIQRVSVKSREEFSSQGGMDIIVPRVILPKTPPVTLVDILGSSDAELVAIGKQGIANSDGTRRGPLSMDANYMEAVQKYFRGVGRNPTDIELESLAQTWSEHCHHTIFADPIDDIEDGLFKTCIKAATEEIRKRKRAEDFCVSVFTDNAGAIAFDDDFLICDKAETHNSPSALDPFGGAVTGIVGVNRDAIGFGLGARPIANGYGFCFGNSNDSRTLYKGKNQTQKMLSPRRIMDGVIEGVNVGGNCSGIPTPQGFALFDDSYRGKPLVFVRTVGMIPRKINGKPSHEKRAMPGDYIVLIGGRVGKDGTHGATFSSEPMDSGSPATAVQIGDPITQKKLSDVVVFEARDKELYNSITDNGAGGLSCSVAEMAKESGGFHVDLEKVPLKYPGLAPWEIWISESQERMTLSVSPEKWDTLQDLMTRRGVEATVIGEFTNSGKCVVNYNGKGIVDLDLEFLHNGLPKRRMQTTFTKIKHEEPSFELPSNLTKSLHEMLARQNITSFEFISQQYDHEVQGGSVIKPLQGRGRVNGDATVLRPKLDSNKAIVLSQGINPSYSEIDTYHMAACAIDTSIRNAVAAGANLEHIALMDNFCWSSSNDPERLGQLKRACEACYDTAVEFGTPFISGKDSMFNDFNGFDEAGNSVKISALPTLLISSLSVIEEAKKAVSIDAKFKGDLIYVLGETKEELGGSEYFAMVGERTRGKKYIGNSVPVVDAKVNRKIYRTFSKAVDKDLVSSAISVNRGGLGVALAKTAIAGQLGMEIDLENVPGSFLREDYTLYSESQGRIVVTINPQNRQAFERLMAPTNYALIGRVSENKFSITQSGMKVVDTTVKNLTESYKSTFRNF